MRLVMPLACISAARCSHGPSSRYLVQATDMTKVAKEKKQEDHGEEKQVEKKAVATPEKVPTASGSWDSHRLDRANSRGLVLGCIKAKFCK